MPIQLFAVAMNLPRGNNNERVLKMFDFTRVIVLPNQEMQLSMLDHVVFCRPGPPSQPFGTSADLVSSSSFSII